MKVAFFGVQSFEKNFIEAANVEFKHELHFFEEKLTEKTAALASSFPCVSVFANDRPNRIALSILKEGGTQILALRSAGFNHVDLKAAEEFGIRVVRVPEYSPYSVAEYAVGLLLCLNRKIHKSYNRVREGNYSLDGLVGFDLHGKTVGVVGTGKIGKAFCNIMLGFGCKVLAFDLKPDSDLEKQQNCSYTTFEDLLKNSDVISLHIPLNSKSFHLLDERHFLLMKPGAYLINTGRGGLIDSKALLRVLKSGHLGAAGLDVYEEEESVFFKDHSFEIPQDEILARLLTFPNVLLTGHQGFLTSEALKAIAFTTLSNIDDFQNNRFLKNEVNL